MKVACKPGVPAMIRVPLIAAVLVGEAAACTVLVSPLSSRVASAESIVIGQTIRTDETKIGVERIFIRYTFHVEEVLRGDHYEPGDILEYEYRVDGNSCSDGRPPPTRGPSWPTIGRCRRT